MPTVDDARQLAEVLVESVIAGYAGLFDDASLHQLAMPHAVRERALGLKERFVDESETFIAAKVGGRVAGWAALRSDSTATVELDSFYIRPTHWGTGVADALLQRVTQIATGNGFTTIELWTLADNARARRVYERNGYSLNAETRTLSYLGEEVQQVRYIKPLD